MSNDKRYHCTAVAEIKAPIETVKPLIFDLTTIPLWNSGVEKIELLQEAASGVGNSRTCFFYDGGSVVEEITDEKEDTVDMAIIKGAPAIIAFMGPRFVVEKIDDETTKLTTSLMFRPKLMPLTSILAKTALKKALGLQAWKITQGVKYYCENLEEVTNKTELPMPPVFDFEYK
jgi:hypothetical protein